MVGFDKNRFVGLTEQESKEYLCGICLEVLKNPKVMTCCRNTFCDECIAQWTRLNDNCPICRASDYSSSLPSLILSNHINEFRLQCNFKDKGCDSVVRVEELESHEIHCNFNPNKECTECQFVGHEEHNCLTVLKVENQKVKEENRKLREFDSKLINQMVFDSAKEALRAGKRFVWFIEYMNVSDNSDPHLPTVQMIEMVKNKFEETVDCIDLSFNIFKGLKQIDANLEWSVCWFMRGNSDHTSHWSSSKLLVLMIGFMQINIYSINK